MSQTDRLTLFAEIIIPLAVPGLFTYRIPFAMNQEAAAGKRAVVQFGKKKIYAGLIRRVHQQVPSGFVPKYVLAILDDNAVVNELQLQFWDWLAEYYMCHTGEVMQAALPSGLRLASESKIVLAPGYIPDHQLLGEYEYLITEALTISAKLSISEVSNIVGFQKVMPLIKTMIEKKIIVMEEELNERYKPRLETFVKLKPPFDEDEYLKKLMDDLGKRAYKQLEILLTYLSIKSKADKDGMISRKLLLEKSGAAHAQLHSLAEKGVFELHEKEVSRLPEYSLDASSDSIELSTQQQFALDEIINSFMAKDVVLLHGVTSSGKTELYIKLMQRAIAQNQQVLYLLPEIALTTQIINRLKKYFGKKIGVYHSRYNEHERVEVWNRVLSHDGQSSDSYNIIVGPRSALFLPFSKLGLIIIDEEHDNSFKQFDPAPRYHARDAAIVLAKMIGTKVLLGSATPSLESWHNSKTLKYGLVQLSERYGGMMLPEVQIVNMREERKRKTMRSHFSKVLMDEIESALKEKAQTILFQNRRGFSLRLECDQCNWVPECRQCDVSLIYHKKQNMLRCHYCGYGIAVPHECPSCHSTALRMHGFGTEKVEEELGILLPESRIARLDLDTTRSKTSFQLILEAFGRGDVDILAGTQMVTKGLDFENVRVVGILNADNMLSYPDFRAYERSYQLMAQVSGRAGRKHTRGKVLIQTFQPYHPLLKHVILNKFDEMAEEQLLLRQQYHYPPYYRLILIKLKHRDEHLLARGASDMAAMLREVFANNVLGPEYPMVSRIKNLYIKQIMIKFSRQHSASRVKHHILEISGKLSRKPDFKPIMIQFDVDPY